LEFGLFALFWYGILTSNASYVLHPYPSLLHLHLYRLDQEIHGPGIDAPLRPTVDHLQTDLSTLHTNLQSLREKVDVVHGHFQDVSGAVTTLQHQVADTDGTLQQVRGRTEEVDVRVGAVEATSATHLDQLRAELDAARTQLALLSNDVTGPTGKVTTLTNRLDTVTAELSTARAALAQQMDAANATHAQLLQALETDTLRKLDGVHTAQSQAGQRIGEMAALVQGLLKENAALKQLVDDQRMQEAQNRSALEQSLQASVATVRAELEQDRTAGRALADGAAKTGDQLERLEQDVQGLRLLDRERNRQLVELAALPQLLSSLHSEVDAFKNGQAARGGAVSADAAAVQTAREDGLWTELANLSREVEGLRQMDQSRAARDGAAMAALREELAAARAELDEMKSSGEAEGRGGAVPAGSSRGIDLNAEISRVQEKTKQLRSSPPSSGPTGPGQMVVSSIADEDDPNDQINTALDGLRKLQESLNGNRGPGGSAPPSAHTSPIMAERKAEPLRPLEKAPKVIESTPQENVNQQDVALLRQARDEISASLATLQKGSATHGVNSPPASSKTDIGAAGHTPAPGARPLSFADPIADAARRRLRDDGSPMVAGPPASFAPDPTAPNVSRGGALPSSSVHSVSASSVATGSYSVATVTSSAPTPARHTGLQLDEGRGMDPPDEMSPARMSEAQRYSDPPDEEASSLAAQVPYYKAPPLEQAATRPSSDAIEIAESPTENKGVILIQKTTDERKKYQYYNPVEDKQHVVEQHSSSVEEVEVTDTNNVVPAPPTLKPAAVETKTEKGLDASDIPPSSPGRAVRDQSPASSPETSKWSTKTAGELIEQRRMQRMLAGRATMEAAVQSKPLSPPVAAEDQLSSRSAASNSSTNPSPRDGDRQRSIRQQQMRKARPQGRQSSAAAPSRHRSIVEEAIQFARSSRGSPSVPSKDMATSPKDFLSKQKKDAQQQKQRRQQRMEKDFGPSPTTARSTETSSPRVESEQSMVVTPDEKSSAAGNNLSIQLEPSPIARSPDDFESLRRATSSGPSAISPINAQRPSQATQRPTSTVQPNESSAGCYLVYLADSGGKLVLHYSKTPVDNAIGFWRAGQGKSIQGFKYRQNSGRVELIKGIAGGDANKRKFFSGWCQFIKAAAAFNGSARKFPNAGGLEVELYAVSKDGTVHFLDVDNEEVDVSQFDAIACLPKNNNLFKGVHNLDVNRFVNTANIAGAALPL